MARRKRGAVILLIVVALALLVFWYFWAFSPTPRGQPALVSLTQRNFSTFIAEFNQAADSPRLVLLLSPT
jgi:hypothetical protein